MKENYYKQEKMENDLAFLTNGLYRGWKRWQDINKSDTFSTSKFISLIIDYCKVSLSTAKIYYGILQSRGIITKIDGDKFEIDGKEYEKKFGKKRLEEAENFFKDLDLKEGKKNDKR